MLWICVLTLTFVPGGTQTPEEAKAIKAIRRAGGLVFLQQDPPGPLHIDVDFPAKIKDETLRTVKGLKALRALRVLGGGITDKGLAHLDGMPRLELLILNAEAITDAGLKQVGKLTSLRKLDFMHARLTHQGLAHLKGLRQLRELYLHAARLTDPDVEPLKEMTWLQILIVPENLSPATVAELRRALPQTRISHGVPGRPS